MSTANSSAFINIKRHGGHYYVTLRAKYNASDKAYTEKIDFILEYFEYFVETNKDKITISLNTNPKHYHKILECGQVIVDS